MIKNSICEDCDEYLKKEKHKNIRQINNFTHYVFCKKCLNNKQICSFTQAKRLFILDDKDLNSLKTIYIANPNNNIKYFILKDIINVALKKHGSEENIYNLRMAKDRENSVRIIKNQLEIEKRKEKLIDVLKENKLDFKGYGDCYSYVMYGTPNIDVVINNELEKLKIIRDRKIKLARELSKHGLIMDEECPLYYNYINGIGCKTIKEIITTIENQQYNNIKTINKIKKNRYNKILLSFD